MKLLMIGIAALAVVGCDKPPCLADNQPAQVENIGTPQYALGERGRDSVDDNTVKLRLADNSKRVCVVPQWVARQLKPGDIVRGPISHNADARYL